MTMVAFFVYACEYISVSEKDDKDRKVREKSVFSAGTADVRFEVKGFVGRLIRESRATDFPGVMKDLEPDKSILPEPFS